MTRNFLLPVWAFAISVVALFATITACSPLSRVNQPYATQWVRIADQAAPNTKMPDVVTKEITFDTSEGTFLNLDVSPDGESLVFDLLGDLYLLPIKGGVGTPLTTGSAWDRSPIFSRDGRSVFFVSDRQGKRNIWKLSLDDRSLEQLSNFQSNIEGTLNWAQSGEQILVSLRDSNNGGLDRVPQAFDLTSRVASPLFSPKGPAFDYIANQLLRPITQVYSAVQTADGKLYYDEAKYDSTLGRNIIRLHTLDIATQKRTETLQYEKGCNDYRPQLSRDGSRLAYFRQYDNRRTEIRILNRETKDDKALVELENTDDAWYGATQDSRPNYAFMPDDSAVIFWHDGKIHRANLADGSHRIIPFEVAVKREVRIRVEPDAQAIGAADNATIVRWPSMSADGQVLSFEAIGYVWLKNLQTGAVRRLTSLDDFEYMPAISPDGKSVAYVSFARTGTSNFGAGRLIITDVETGTVRTLLAKPNETYLNPSWSQDGQNIAVIREVASNGMTDAAFGWTHATLGEFQVVANAPPSRSIISAPVYARYVGFDASGRNLRFSYPVSKKEINLATSTLDGRDRRIVAVGTSDVGGITPAPDLQKLALTRRNGTVWIVPFDASDDAVEVSTLESNASRVGNTGGYYIAWQGLNDITFGFGQRVYRSRLDLGETESQRIAVDLTSVDTHQVIAFTGARLLTMAAGEGVGQIIESGTVVVKGDRIAAIGPTSAVAIPPDALNIDVAGTTILPGFLDTHYHRIGGTSQGMSSFRKPSANLSDRTAIAYGITTAWEPGGVWDDGSPATADLQRAGRIMGPRWSQSALGGIGAPYELLTSYQDALAAVDQHKALGVSVLKASGVPDRQQQQWLSAAAQERGMGIVAHVDDFEGMMTRIIDGYTGGEHPYIPIPFYSDVYELLLQSGFIWTPNIMITSGSVGGDREVRNYYWEAVLEKRPGELEKLKEMTSPDRAEETLITEPAVLYRNHRVRNVAQQAAAAAKKGVHVGVSAHNMPGAGLHGEIWYLWKGGLPVDDVLQAATMGNAEKLGLQEEVGSLEVGKLADFLVLDDNPLDNILNTLSLKYTVQGGVVYDSTTAERIDLSTIAELTRSEAANDGNAYLPRTGTND